MIDEFALHKARELANSIRYSEDQHDKNFGQQPLSLNEVTDEFYRTAIEINEYVTPDLENALQRVCTRLQLDRNIISAFANNSHEVQAACYYVEPTLCLIRLSSALINLLELKEVEFVIAHEIGHFLLKHAPLGTSNKTAEYFVFQRAKEISADRIGLVGCGSIEAAGSAMMKTASGLKHNYLNLNLDNYLLQLNQISDNNSGENPFGTHPSMLLRANALNLFNASKIDQISYSDFEKVSVFNCDKEISQFLSNFSDQEFHKRVAEAKLDLKMWIAASLIVQDKKFTKQ